MSCRKTREPRIDQIKIEQLNDQQKNDLDIPDTPQRQGPWSVWECNPTSFDWHYDQREQAYVYEGKVKAGEQEVEINSGDFVSFPRGLDCRWEVLETIRKVYKFE